MWEGDPVGVDQKRPLVGFALVAVLCVVLMTLSVGRGWGGELFHPGKPIAAPAAGGHLDRVPSPSHQPVEPAAVSIPVELSAQPLAVAVGAPMAKKAVARPTAETETGPETVAQDSTRAADKAAAKAQRQADKAAEQAASDAAKLVDQLLRIDAKAAEKALRQG